MKEIEHMNHESRDKHVEPGASRGFSGRIVVRLSATCPEITVAERRFAGLVRSMRVILLLFKLFARSTSAVKWPTFPLK